MATSVSGPLRLVTNAPATFVQVMVRAPKPRPHAGGMVVDFATPASVEDGTVSFPCVPGPAVLLVANARVPQVTVKLVVPDTADATLEECIRAAELADGWTLTELERLAQQIAADVADAGALAEKLGGIDGIAQTRTALEEAAQTTTDNAQSVERAKTDIINARDDAEKAAGTAGGSATLAGKDADRAEAARKGAETIQQGLPDKIGQELEAKLPGELERRINDMSNVGGRVPLVQSHDEGRALPAGSVYAIPADKALPPEPEAEPEPGIWVSPVGRTTQLGSNTVVSGRTFPASTTDKDGVVIAALATKASGGQTPRFDRADTTVLLEPYWKGTLIGHIVAMPYDIHNTSVDFGDESIQGVGAFVHVEGVTVDQLVVGEASDREKYGEPTKILAPSVGYEALAFFFERTTAEEDPADITFNSNWQPVEVGVGDGIVETAVIAVGGPGDAIATYPNSQALNGIGVQVGIKA